MRRPVALLSAALLLATAICAGGVNAADSTHLRLTRTGAIVAFSALHDGLMVQTELGVSTDATKDGVTQPYLWINQIGYGADAFGVYNQLVWRLEGNTTTFSLTVANQLASATVTTAAMTTFRCDPFDNCTESTAAIAASFTAVGPTQHSHQHSISSISHESMFIFNSVGASRVATASVSVAGVTYGPSTNPADASIYDTRTGTIDKVKAAVPVGN